jgi:hypothetical protein
MLFFISLMDAKTIAYIHPIMPSENVNKYIIFKMFIQYPLSDYTNSK